MQNTPTFLKQADQKIAKFASNKNLAPKNPKISDQDSLLFWMGQYFEKMVDGSKERTTDAKKSDLKRFLAHLQSNQRMDSN